MCAAEDTHAELPEQLMPAKAEGRRMRGVRRVEIALSCILAEVYTRC